MSEGYSNHTLAIMGVLTLGPQTAAEIARRLSYPVELVEEKLVGLEEDGRAVELAFGAWALLVTP